MKSGAGDRPSAAEGQNREAIEALREHHGGNNDVQLYQRTGKNTLGGNLSATFDLSPISAGDVDATMGQFTRTSGLPGKGFNETLDFGSEDASADEARAVLERVARYLLAQEALLRWQPDPTTPLPSPAAMGGQGGPVLVAPAPGDLDRRQR